MANIESWFITADIVKVMCSVFVVTVALLFLLTIAFSKTCHTVPMLLITNSLCAELIFGIVMLSMDIFTIQNDYKKTYFYDSFCLFQGYMSYMSTGIQNYSYLLQAIYRYVLSVYPTHLYYHSARFQLILISFTWICSIIYPISIVITNQIKYHPDNQICQMPLNLSFITIFNISYLYLIPIGAIILIYFKMIRYVREISKRVSVVNTLFRTQRELRMIQRIVSLVFILVTLGLPYTIFIVLSFFKHEPKYHFRITYIFVNISLAFVLIALFQTTEPLKISVIRILKKPTTEVLPPMI